MQSPHNLSYEQFAIGIEGTLQSTLEACHKVPWQNKKVYGDFLAQTYYYVRQATRLLSYAAARCPLQDEPQHRQIIKGVAEEKDHEMLALKDLHELGLNIQDLPERPETSAYYQTLYYNIDHYGPQALFGYFIVLEGLAGQKFEPVLNLLKDHYGDLNCSFLRVHCSLDVGHYSEAMRMFESMSPIQLHTILSMARLSSHLYNSILTAVSDHAIERVRPHHNREAELSLY